jgi:hypothetical protein
VSVFEFISVMVTIAGKSKDNPRITRERLKNGVKSGKLSSSP